MSEEQVAYAKWIDKKASGICPVCDKLYKEHEHPQKVPCPDCGLIDDVHSWEAWGHPNGELECLRCFSRPRTPDKPYHTFYKGPDGETVIVPWHRSVGGSGDEWDADDEEYESGPD